MFAVPKLSAPLTKAARTSEGILVWLVNLGLAAGAVLEPGKLPPKEAAVVGSALAGLHVASRTLLKITAVQHDVGLPAPVQPTGLTTEHIIEGVLRAAVGQALADAAKTPSAATVAAQVVSDAEEFASQPPAALVVSPRLESAVVPDAPAVPVQAAAPAAAEAST